MAGAGAVGEASGVNCGSSPLIVSWQRLVLGDQASGTPLCKNVRLGS